MSKVFFLLGKNPELSMAEIQASYPGAVLEFGHEFFAVFDFGEPEDAKALSRLQALGGIQKAALLDKETTSHHLAHDLADLISEGAGDQKVVYGVSVYGLPERQLKGLLMAIKRSHQEKGVKSRFINKNNLNISAAQYWHHLKDGREFVVVKAGSRFYLGLVTTVQDIEGYSERDYGKPFRDPRMGMLPPKLAQILLNLSGALPGQTVWDPFCGSGTIVMEGALMGLRMIGSDLHAAAVEGARKNAEWLAKKASLRFMPELMVHDATQPVETIHELSLRNGCVAVVFEGDLGPPLSHVPRPDELRKTLDRLHDLYVRSFSAFAAALKPGGVIVAALPFFALDHRTVFLKETVAEIQKRGFSLRPFLVGSRPHDLLIYRRPDQRVGRAIVRFDRT